MPIQARLEQSSPSGNRRNSTRHKLRLTTSASISGDEQAEVVIHDLSRTGLLLETSAPLTIGDTLDVDIPEASSMPAKIVWHGGRFFGASFSKPISKAAFSASVLQSPPLGKAADSTVEDEDPADLLEQALVESRIPRTHNWNLANGDLHNRASLPARLRMIFALTVASWTVLGSIVALLWLATSPF